MFDMDKKGLDNPDPVLVGEVAPDEANCLEETGGTGSCQEGSSPGSLGEVEELKETVKSLQRSLSEAHKRIETLEREGKGDKKMLAIYRSAFPEFEQQREELKHLLKVEKVIKQLVAALEIMMGEVIKMGRGKQNEVAQLTRRIGQLEKRNGGTLTMNPGTGENAGAKEAVLIFPEEVWELILQKVTNPKDLWSCSNTCSLFKKILHDWKEPTGLFRHALPYLFRYLPRDKIIKCRLVSKGWNMVVEQFLENHPSLRGHQDKKGFDYRTMLPLGGPLLEKQFDKMYRFDLRNDRGIPGFPYTPGRNPFIGRAVTLVIGMPKAEDSEDDYFGSRHSYVDYEAQDENIKRFWERIFFFLKNYGEHIWYLTLDSYEGNLGDGDDYHKQMFKLLTRELPSFLPNLRNMRILQGGYEEYGVLGDDIDVTSFPVAPKLETIVADDSSLFSQLNHLPLVAVIERHHSQLRVLHLSGTLFGSHHLRWLEWPELRELYLDNLFDKKDFEILEEAVLPNLRKLGVNLRGRYWSFDWLLDVLHKFFGSTQLTTLRICGGIGPRMFQRLRWKSCMSPMLTTLEVEHGKGGGFYKFLHYFPLVENLHVFEKNVPPFKESEFRPCDPGEEHSVEDTQQGLEEVDLGKYIFQGKVYHSNVWEVLPRLKLVTFKWDAYTRSGYEQVVERRN